MMQALLLASSAGTGIAMAIGGILAVLAVSAFFYAIGRGEDRDRSQAARAAEDEGEGDSAAVPPPADEPPPAADPHERPSLPASARPRRRR